MASLLSASFDEDGSVEELLAGLSATVVSTADHCVCCGAAPPPGVRLKKCTLCRKTQLPGGYYCSRECQKKDWPKHKAWHKQQANIARLHEAENTPITLNAPPQSAEHSNCPLATETIKAWQTQWSDIAKAYEADNTPTTLNVTPQSASAEHSSCDSPLDADTIKQHATFIRMLEPALPAADAIRRAEIQVRKTDLIYTMGGRELKCLIDKACELKAQHDLSKAIRKLRKAIKLEPLSPQPYDALGDTLSRSQDGPGAAVAWMEALDRYPTGCVHWGTCVAHVFDIMSRPLVNKPPFPAWWNDDTLMTLSSLVMGATRTDESLTSTDARIFVLVMRAEVLSGIGPPRLLEGHVSSPQWQVGSRTPEQVHDGGKLFAAAATLAANAHYPASAMKDGFRVAALACFKRSDGVVAS